MTGSLALQQKDGRKNPNDRSWLVVGQRAFFERHGEQRAGNVKEVYPEPPYSEYVKVKLDDGEDAYIPFTRIAEEMETRE